MRHMESVGLSKFEIKAIAGHHVAWIEVTTGDMTQTMDDQDITDESDDQTLVTICAIGDAKTPTRGALRDAPRSSVHTISRSTMQDDGTLKDHGKNGEETETTLDIALANNGTVTVKLASGSVDVIPPEVLGPHKLW